MADQGFQQILELLSRIRSIDEFRELHDSVQRAIDITPQDPDMALTRARKALEFIVQDVYSRRYKKDPGTQTLDNLLRTLEKDGVMSRILWSYAQNVKELGNIGTHGRGERVTAQHVMRSLDDLKMLLDWYVDEIRTDVRRAPEAKPISSLLHSTIGEYRLVDFLGAGGMGEVYRAVHVRIGRVVAMKVLSTRNVDSNVVQRFLNEARIQATLRHPGIATLYDFLETDGRPVIIMEYVDGQTVAERIASKGPLSFSNAAAVIASVADTIAYVHSQGIVHRDLKAGNIKINSAGEVKLLDFGIAKGPDAAHLTKTRAVVGTFQNLAPEQLEGHPATYCSDIWSLGTVLYEMVTGRPPFNSENPSELMTKILKAEYPQASGVNRSVPPAMDQVIGRCLAKRPADRYPTAREVRAAVLPFTAARAPEPVAADAPVAPKRRFRPARWQMIAAPILVVLLLAAGLLFSHKSADKSGTAQLKTVHLDVLGGKAEVYVNEKDWGPAPLVIERPVGDYFTVTFKREGYWDYKVNYEVKEEGNEHAYPMARINR